MISIPRKTQYRLNKIAANRLVFLFWLLLSLILIFSCASERQAGFRHYPYLQNPGSTAMIIMWFSETNASGQLTYTEEGGTKSSQIKSTPTFADALKYSTWEDTTFFEDGAPAIPFRHRVKIDDLKPATRYEYTVAQGADSFSSSFMTAPDRDVPVRFIVYADSETEPESTGKHTQWDDPKSDAPRTYLIDQTDGYHNNLQVINDREPDLIIIAGDLVESGGEQRDWDEFWLHNTSPGHEHSIASRIPILAAMGNHEYFEGPKTGRYNQPGSGRAASKYLSYFEYPSNHAQRGEQNSRYYSLKYGPATLIVVDLCNNSPGKSAEDTNFFLLGENEPGGGFAPDFGPHSEQYKWIEKQLTEAQQNSLFTFVVFHHAPYSSGPHGVPPGEDGKTDPQSGRATRILTPMFLQYGVDAVFNGHDEMWERSEISGLELKPDGSKSEHSIQFYDVGIGGDGLRAPIQGLENPYQQFLVHTDVPEKWEGGILLDGGKHYGHLEVDIVPQDSAHWQATLKPIYILPQLGKDGKTYSTYSRRMYDDKITLVRALN